jgi:hypothetical protein
MGIKQFAAQPERRAAEMGVIAVLRRESMKLDQIFVIKEFRWFWTKESRGCRHPPARRVAEI